MVKTLSTVLHLGSHFVVIKLHGNSNYSIVGSINYSSYLKFHLNKNVNRRQLWYELWINNMFVDFEKLKGLRNALPLSLLSNILFYLSFYQTTHNEQSS